MSGDPLETRLTAIVTEAYNVVARLGIFPAVAQSEPKAKPAAGTAAMWVDRIKPIQSSGLDSVSCLLIVLVRIYLDFNAEPTDKNETAMVYRAAAVMRAFSGHFTLPNSAGTNLVRSVDIFGIHGSAMDAVAGYVNQDGTLYRVTTVTLPLIVDDLLDEVA